MRGKIFALITSTLIIANFSSVFALEKIYEKETNEKISSGVLLKNYERFTDKGWLSINIAEVDLNDKNTNVKLMNSENGLKTFQTVYKMAETNDAILAINGDFFNGKSTRGNTIGLSISEGELLTTTYYENEIKDTFASFVLDEKDNAWFDYFSNVITLKNQKNKEEFLVGEYNKISSNYIYPVIYTSEWGEYSIGNVDNGIPLTEMLVRNNKVVEIREDGQPIEIPKNGYVVSTIGETATRMKGIFSKNNKVEISVEMGLDIDNVKMAVSGGAMLLVDGEIPEKFSADITGSHPRTAMGLSEDGETLYLITVDGRSDTSIGMTQKELAEFLKEKGIYNAMNLDGGGSTTMVARKLGNDFISTINRVSDGTLRMVTNAIGIFNTNKKSNLAELIIELPKTKLKVGEKVEVKVKGYDKYYNPKNVELDDIKWNVEGVEVTIENGILIAGDVSGIAKVTAKKGKVEKEIEIEVLQEEKTFEELFLKNEEVRVNESGDIIEESFKFVLYEAVENNGTLLSNLVKNKYVEKLNSEVDAMILLNESVVLMGEETDVLMIVNNGYKCENVNNATFISINMLNNGIRKTDYTQWTSFQNDIKNSKNKNIFLMLNGTLSEFDDIKEQELFEQQIKELEQEFNKNIFLIMQGEKTSFEIINGVKNIEFGNDLIDESGAEKLMHESSYVEFTVYDDGRVEYEKKKIY